MKKPQNYDKLPPFAQADYHLNEYCRYMELLDDPNTKNAQQLADFHLKEMNDIMLENPL